MFDSSEAFRLGDFILEYDIQAAVNRISLTDFGMAFQHRATFNGRLRTTGGRFLLKTENLEFNPKMFAQVDEATRVGIIRHELCHYHLYRQHKGYKHIDQDFKHLLKQVGGLRYAPRLTPTKPIRIWVYRCENCGQEGLRRRRFDTSRYVCGRCGGHFALIGQRSA